MKQLAWVQFFSWFALFSMWIYTVPAVTQHIYGTTDTNIWSLQYGCQSSRWNLPNYNLIAATFLFIATIGKIYESKIHTLCRIVLRRTWSYVCLFHNWTRIHYGMASNVCRSLSSILSIPYAMLSGSLPSDKMAITWSFQLLYSNPPVSCRIHFRVLVLNFIMNLFILFDWGASMILAELSHLLLMTKQNYNKWIRKHSSSTLTE
jgi:maltose/moltooligosaccharide transporter